MAITKLQPFNLDSTANYTFANIATDNANLGNLATANFFSGAGNNLSNISGGNVTGQVANATVAGTVYTNAQPNITSVGTLTDLSVSGNGVFGGNLTVNGTLTYINSTTLSISDPIINLQTGPNGAAPVANTGKDVGTALNYYDTSAKISWMGWDVSNAEIAFGSNVSISSEVVTFTSLANIRSGNAQLGNTVTANFFSGSGNNLSNIPSANITGQVGNALIAGTVYTNAQPNITSVGSLTGLTVSNATGVVDFTTTANVTLGAVGNLHISGGTSTYVLSTDGAGTLSWVAQSGGGSASISNGNSNVSIPTSNGNINFSAVGNANIVVITGTGANISGTANVSGNLSAGNIVTGSGTGGSITGADVVAANTLTASSNITTPQFISNVSIGTAPLVVTSTTQVANLNVATAGIAGTVTTNAQPNITSVGTLSSLTVTGNITGGNLIGPLANGNSNVSIPSANGNINLTAVGNTVVVITDTGVNVAGTLNTGSGIITGNGNGLSSIVGANVTGQVGNALVAGTVYTNAQPNITSVGTLTSLVVTGNISSGDANLGNTVSANYFIGSGNNLSNIQGGNVTGQVGNALISGTVYTNAQPNITSVGTLTSLVVTGNLDAGNANLGNTVSANYFIGSGNNLSNIQGSNVTGQVGNALVAGTVYTNAQPNITSTGSLTGLTVSNATGVVDFTTTANVTLGAVGNLHISGGTSTYVLSTDGAGTLSWVAQSGGSASISNGNSNVSIPSANGNINFSAVGNANILVVTGTGANIAGTLNVTGNANVGNLDTAQVLASANVTAPQLISNIAIGTAPFIVTSTTQVANLNVATAGTVTTAAQPNITSTGSLTGLTVSNATGVVDFTTTANVTLGAVANLHISGGTSAYVLSTDGAGTLSWVAQSGGGGGSSISNGNSNVSIPSANGNVNISAVGNANILVVTGTGANIAGTLNVTGQSNLGAVGNVVITGGTNGYVLQTDGSGTLSWVAQSGGGSSSISNGNSNVSIPSANGNINFTAVSNTTMVITDTGANINGTATITGNLDAGNANLGNLVTANYFIGSGNNLSNIQGSNVTGQVGNAVVAGTVYTNAQPNITSVGTLTSLSVTGNTTSGNFIGTLANGNSNVSIPSANGNINFTAVSNTTMVITDTGANISGTANVTGNLSAGNISAGSGSGGNITGANLVSANYFTGTLTTGAQPNITSVGTLTSLVVTGNISSGNANLGNTASANYFIGSGNNLSNIQGSNVTGQVGNALISGTVYTNAQPNITSVGTLTSLNVVGTVTAAAFTANTGVFTGNGNGLSSIVGANVTGQVGNALVAGTVYTNAQPNITSTGSLTGLTVSNATGVVDFTTTANVTLGAVANLHISGGTSAYVLSTDGAGTLSWVAQSGGGSASISNGNSNVSIPSANGNVNISAVGNANVVIITGTGANIAGTLNVTGQSNLGAVGNVVITGGTNGYVLQTDGSGTLSWVAQSGGGGGSSISNGNSNVSIPSANGNINFSAVGNANILVVTGTGANIAGTLNVTGNATLGTVISSGSGGNISNANVISANTFIASSNFIGALANGNSDVNIPSANGNINFTAVGNANVVVITGTGANISGTANITGNVNVGNLIGPHANGNSNVNIPSANGNINFSAVGNANVVVITGTGANISGTLNATGNLTVGNLSVTGGIAPRVVVIADATSVTINGNTTDIATQTNTQAVGTLTINAPTGTPSNGQKIMFRLQSTNVQTFAWDGIFQGSSDISLPTTSSGAGKYDYVGFIYNTTATKWQLIAKNFGF